MSYFALFDIMSIFQKKALIFDRLKNGIFRGAEQGKKTGRSYCFY